MDGAGRRLNAAQVSGDAAKQLAALEEAITDKSGQANLPPFSSSVTDPRKAPISVSFAPTETGLTANSKSIQSPKQPVKSITPKSTKGTLLAYFRPTTTPTAKQLFPTSDLVDSSDVIDDISSASPPQVATTILTDAPSVVLSQTEILALDSEEEEIVPSSPPAETANSIDLTQDYNSEVSIASSSPVACFQPIDSDDLVDTPVDVEPRRRLTRGCNTPQYIAVRKTLPPESVVDQPEYILAVDTLPKSTSEEQSPCAPISISSTATQLPASDTHFTVNNSEAFAIPDPRSPHSSSDGSDIPSPPHIGFSEHETAPTRAGNSPPTLASNSAPATKEESFIDAWFDNDMLIVPSFAVESKTRQSSESERKNTSASDESFDFGGVPNFSLDSPNHTASLDERDAVEEVVQVENDYELALRLQQEFDNENKGV